MNTATIDRFNKNKKDETEQLIYGEDLSKYGKDFQMKFLALLIKDRSFSESILPIVKINYFSDIYMKKIFSCIEEYKIEYPNSTPSTDNILITLQNKKEKIVTYKIILDQIDKIDLGDRDFVIKNSTRFCFSKHALLEQEKIKILLEEGKFEEAQKISFESFKHSGLTTSTIYDLKEDHEKIFNEAELHRPVPLPWPTFNKVSKGGPGAANLIISVAFSNFGKSFQAGTKIRLFDLSLKNVEDIKAGDKLLGPDGKSRTVISLATGEEEMYEIKQSNGLNYTVNKSHILCLKNKKQYIDIEVGDYLKKNEWWKNNVFGYKAPQEFEERVLKLDPYYLGLSLGEYFDKDSTIYSIDKLIPDDYLFSSRLQRLELLAGLIDSLGCLRQFKTIYFNIVEKAELTRQIYILASGLGFKTKYVVSEDNLYAGVIIMGDLHLIPTKIPENKTKIRKKKYDTTTSTLKVIPKGMGRYYGFILSENDPDRKFLLEDFTVAHNTAALTAYARHANLLGKNVAFFSFEIGGLDIIKRYIAGVVNERQEDLINNKEKIKDRILDEKLGGFKLIEEKATLATTHFIKSKLEYLKSTGFFPDAVMVDSLNQLKVVGKRPADNNEKFEILSEELRDLSKDYGNPFHTVYQTNRCLKIDSQVIEKNKGQIFLKDLKQGEYILTNNGYKKVLKIYDIQKQKCYRIKLKNGKEIICSVNHEFPTSDNKLVSIDTGLTIGNKLLCKK